MKYSLRSLMIVVTLACVVVGGRIEYARRAAAYHGHQKERWLQEQLRLRESQKSTEAEHKAAIESWIYHWTLEREYSAAVFRPWKLVDEKSAKVDIDE